MKFDVVAVALVGALFFLSGPARAGDAVSKIPGAKVERQIKARLTHMLHGLKVTAVRRIPGTDLYEVSSNNNKMIYATADGSHILVGDLYSLRNGRVDNLTEAHMAGRRKALLDAVPASQMITFAPKGKPKAVVDVFTDVDCYYCRKMHAQIGRYTGLGIQVNYLAYPRTGPNTPSFFKYESVWCAKDRKRAFVEAMEDVSLPRRHCPNPVLSQYRLGDQVGVDGTPTIVLPSGRTIPGYVPPRELARRLGIL